MLLALGQCKKLKLEIINTFFSETSFLWKVLHWWNDTIERNKKPKMSQHQTSNCLIECFISIPPENIRKPRFSGGIEIEHWVKMGSCKSNAMSQLWRVVFLDYDKKSVVNKNEKFHFNNNLCFANFKKIRMVCFLNQYLNTSKFENVGR